MMWPSLLAVREVRANNGWWRPVLAPLDWISRSVEGGCRVVSLQEVPSDEVIPGRWRSSVIDDDGRVNRISYVWALAIVAASARERSDFLLTLSATGAWPRARIICQCARQHPALLANGASCSHSLPVGSPNPSPADAFAKRVSRTVLTRGGPQKCVAVMARRQDRQKGRFSRTGPAHNRR